MKIPMSVLRPVSTSDGEGGKTETYQGLPTIYGVMRVHQEEISVNVDVGEDIAVGDVIEVDKQG